MSGVVTRVRNLFYPPKCVSCGKLLHWYDCADDSAEGRINAGVLCDACSLGWQSALLETCGVCGLEVGLCSCLTEELKHSRAEAFYKLVYYKHHTRHAVQNRVIYFIKRRRDRNLTEWLAWLLEDRIGPLLMAYDPSQILLTYVPRSARSKAKYGTDQAEELARALSYLTGVPYKALFSRKRRFFEREQKSLSAEGRMENAQASYVPVRRIRALSEGKQIVLIDDIVTTGASMSVCIRLLQDAGAAQVHCLAIASDELNRDMGVLSPNFDPKKKDAKKK